MFEAFILDLEAVEPVYSRDLSLKNGLGISHPRVLGLLLGLLLGALSLRPSKFCPYLGPQGFVHGLFRDALSLLGLR